MSPVAMTLEQFAAQLEQVTQIRDAGSGIGVADPEAAAYARVLEYGSIVGQPPWPHPGARTVLAVDPETGAQVVVSAQAPQGFIRVSAPDFLNALRSELAEPADWLNPDDAQSRIGQAVRAAAESALETLRAGAPHDSGRLSQSLEIVAE